MMAITRVPASKMQGCLRTFLSPEHGVPIDEDLGRQQHAAYCRLLAACGASLVALPALEELPDSTFVEDTAIVLDELAVICSMGTAARRGEPPHIESSLQAQRELERIELPATIEGGDVLRVGRTLLVGRSCRTNDAGVAALARLAGRLNYAVLPVPVRGCLHLKTACTALPDGRLLVNPRWIDTAPLASFQLLPVPESEPWGANALAIGDNLLLCAAHQATAHLIERLGFRVLRCDLSEFAKAEGGVTCLSLLVA